MVQGELIYLPPFFLSLSLPSSLPDCLPLSLLLPPPLPSPLSSPLTVLWVLDSSALRATASAFPAVGFRNHVVSLHTAKSTFFSVKESEGDAEPPSAQIPIIRDL